jgi:hypothetical protein
MSALTITQFVELQKGHGDRVEKFFGFDKGRIAEL